MAIKDALLAEFDHEMATTRRVLERVPEDAGDWTPHTKSMPLVRLAGHLAELPGLGLATLKADAFDVASEEYRPYRFGSRAEALALFDDYVKQLRAAIEATDDERFLQSWNFLRNGQVMFAVPRVAAYRTFFMNHQIHHRGQLTVYLRLRDVPVPGVYGPSADEPM